MRATLAQAEEIARLSEGYRLNAAPGDPTLARCAEQLRRYAERIEQEATAPGEQLTAELTNPLARRRRAGRPARLGADTDSD